MHILGNLFELVSKKFKCQKKLHRMLMFFTYKYKDSIMYENRHKRISKKVRGRKKKRLAFKNTKKFSPDHKKEGILLSI